MGVTFDRKFFGRKYLTEKMFMAERHNNYLKNTNISK